MRGDSFAARVSSGEPRPIPAGSAVPADVPWDRPPTLMTPAVRKAIRQRMLFARQAALDRLAELTGRPVSELRGYRQELARSEVPDLLVQRGAGLPFTKELPQASLLYLLVRALRPTRVVETGVRPGYSTAWILAALRANDHGELFSLGPGTFAGRATGLQGPSVGQLVPPMLRARWTLVLGNSVERLDELLRSRAPFGLFFSDNGPDADRARQELRRGWSSLAPGGVLAAHHVDASPAWREFCRWQGVDASLLDPGPPPLGALSMRTEGAGL